MNQGIFGVIGRVAFAALGVAIAAIAPTSASASTSQVEQKSRGAQEQVSPATIDTALATLPERTITQEPTRRSTRQNQPSRTPSRQNQPNRRPTEENKVQLPEPVTKAILENLAQQTGLETSDLRVVEVEQKTWSDGCLGLGNPGIACSQALVPGWQVTVASDRQRWIYRTNLSGSLVKLDAAATQQLADGATPPTAEQPNPRENPRTRNRRTSRPTPPATTATEPASEVTAPATPPPVAPNNRIQTPVVQTPAEGQESFSLAIRQPSGTLSEIIARVSLKVKRNDGYAPERFIGDYRYRLNQRATFRRGMNVGDRIVVRLYDLQNRLIGYSEFEVLLANAAVNLILGNRPTATRVVRTVYGIDINADGLIDPGTTTYDYFTQINGTNAGAEQVLFLANLQDVNLSWYQVPGLPVPPQSSVYPGTISSGASVVFGSDLPATLTAIPGRESRLINVEVGNGSVYDVSSVLASAPEPAQPAPTPAPTPEPVPEVEISFPDVPANYWARNFIGQLVGRGLLQGYPDGAFRPNDPVTRAELATIISKAFDRNKTREMATFRDLATNHWAYPAISDAYEMGFLGSPNSRSFNPDQNVSRLDVLVALARGLGLTPSGSPERILRVYRDAGTIAAEEQRAIAAATEKGLVVSYPNVRFLNPRRVATRAEVAALIYQALVSTGQANAIASPYVVKEGATASEPERPSRPRQNSERRTPIRRRTTTQPRRQTQPVQRFGTQQRRQTQPVQRTTTQPRRQTQPVQRTTTQPRRQTQPVQRFGTQQRRQTQPVQRTTTQPRRQTQPVQRFGTQQRRQTQPVQRTTTQPRRQTQPVQRTQPRRQTQS
ncbi:S-layer homology domain-containing protein [Microseira wollei]|uniref:S-layer domain-containing protein n=1 Tax=Microseira wollei NIES-4236 TaxID=2530354 RepID=A0AAV3XRB2_9CYAN|nr:S-layer homology domain-containing protein [Microseira wollei]GET44376.1 S-layer domain-containing protein [Microseira wollei NIES-4236]